MENIIAKVIENFKKEKVKPSWIEKEKPSWMFS